MDISGDIDQFFSWVHSHYQSIHIEKATAGVYETDYERKEGRFVCDRDKLEALKCRYGVPNGIQKEFERILGTQSVREIDTWYDPAGCHGKSWWAVHMADTGKALYVPSSQSSPGNLESFIVHNWKGEDFIIIDIPRAAEIPDTLYEVLERIKDGWLVSTKWQGKSANVRGTKVAVFTNTKLDTSKLSKDRWRLHGIKTNGMRMLPVLEREAVRTLLEMGRMSEMELPGCQNELCIFWVQGKCTQVQAVLPIEEQCRREAAREPSYS